MLGQALDWCLLCLNFVLSAPYYKLFYRGTYIPMQRLLQSDEADDLQKWLHYKAREAGYVQVAVSSAHTCLRVSGPQCYRQDSLTIVRTRAR